jgi:kynureninase
MEIPLQAVKKLDQEDELRHFRDKFWIPPHHDGSEKLYFCGHSLGLQPRSAEAFVHEELRAWRDRGVEGHFKGSPAWIEYNELLCEALAILTGAAPHEIVAMNTLTVNLHLMMVSFYRPEGKRRKILIEKNAFPSDRYAVESQIRFHGLDPEDCLVELEPEADSRLIDEGSVESFLDAHGEEIALVLWPGVQYASGQSFDLARIAAAGRSAGACIGFDLAHSIGNVPLSLHETACDFAAWCSYKYLNGGPGAVAACFVHERHHRSGRLPRFQGWWGNHRASRFAMGPDFQAAPGARAWQLSNPPILAMAPLRASLQLFQEAGMDSIRRKSVAMTGWLDAMIETELKGVIEIITPRDPRRRGCQLSLRVCAGREAGRRLFRYLDERGVVSDWREPDIIRVTPIPLYNRFEDCFRLARYMCDWAEELQGAA